MERKDGQIHKFAECFGLNESKLKELLALNLSSALNELGRFDDLKDTADFEKVKNYFKKHNGEISSFKIRNLFAALLPRFIVSGGFDID